MTMSRVKVYRDSFPLGCTASQYARKGVAEVQPNPGMVSVGCQTQWSIGTNIYKPRNVKYMEPKPMANPSRQLKRLGVGVQPNKIDKEEVSCYNTLTITCIWMCYV